MLWLILHHLLQATPATGATMTTHTIEPPTREDLLEKITHLNTAAKAISRRGYVGLMSAEYKRRHDDINDAITQLVGP